MGIGFVCTRTKEQEQILLRWIGCQRLIYNAKVHEDRYFRRFAQRIVGTAGEPIPVDQQYSPFITERMAFLRGVPSQILRNGAVKFRQAYTRFFQKLGGRPKIKKKTGRQAVWLTSELFEFISQVEAVTGETQAYHLHVGTDKFPVGIIPDVAHRPRIVRRNAPSAHSSPRTIGQPKPNLSANAADTRITRTTMPPWLLRSAVSQHSFPELRSRRRINGRGFFDS